MNHKILFFLLVMVCFFLCPISVSATDCDKYQCITCESQFRQDGITITWSVESNGDGTGTVDATIKPTNSSSTSHYTLNHTLKYEDFYDEATDSLDCVENFWIKNSGNNEISIALERTPGYTVARNVGTTRTQNNNQEATDDNIANSGGVGGCEGVFGAVDADGNFEEESFGWLLQKLLDYIKIAGPVLVILLSMLEFIKAIATADEEAMKKAQSRLVIRIIAVLALFLLPFLVGEVLKLINGISNPTCYFK